MHKEKTIAILKEFTEVIGLPEITEKLDKNKSLRIKAGFDPTRSDLHLGHAVLLFRLRQLQELGHTVIMVIGDFTASIGDPTGKNITRMQISQKDTKVNGATYANQALKILSKKTEFVYNSNWLNQLSALDLINIAAKYNVARMLERDDFEKRYKNNDSIAMHEFLYPLLQGYDSVELKSDLEIGGTDQKFNLLVGRHLQKAFGQSAQAIATLPIIEGLDGTKKMSKSLNNHIPLTTSANDMYAKIMSINDLMIFSYNEALGIKTKTELRELRAKIESGYNPKFAKMELAHTITAKFHSEDCANQAQNYFIDRFQKKSATVEYPKKTLKAAAGMNIVDIIFELNILSSKSGIRRLIKQGAVRLGDEKIKDFNVEFDQSFERILSLGKKNVINLHFVVDKE